MVRVVTVVIHDALDGNSISINFGTLGLGKGGDGRDRRLKLGFSKRYCHSRGMTRFYTM